MNLANEFLGPSVGVLDGFNYADLAVTATAIVANSVVLCGINENSIHLISHRRFLKSLLGSNLFACVVNLLLIGMATAPAAARAAAKPGQNQQNELLHLLSIPKCVSEIVRRFSIVGFIANLLSLMALATDHFIGIIKPIQYKGLMNNCLARRSVFVIWSLAFVIGFVDFPFRAIAIATQKKLTETAMCNRNFQDFSNVLKAMNDSEMESMFDLEELSILQSLSEVNDLKIQMPCVKNAGDSNSANQAKIGWCDQFNGSNDVWLQLLLVILTIGSLIILGFFVHFVFAEATETQVDMIRKKLRRLIITAFLLLGTFFLCWAPLVAYEICMVLVAELIQASVSSQDKLLLVHKILFSLYLCSPLFLPFIYVARNRAVRREIFSICSCCILLRHRYTTPPPPVDGALRSVRSSMIPSPPQSTLI